MIRKIIARIAIRRKLLQEHRSGRITKTQYKRLRKACTLEVCEAAVGNSVNKSGLSDWPILSAIVNFVIEHWDEILKFIIMVAPLILEEQDD